MSWQAASLAIVVASLAGCFWWYERSRPSSKEVALVATMAALSALGRDAFAALPDVKPTTAMVLICGYAFGGVPGFAVGAVGALASNIFLGQGSWTPWQMLAWGAVGVAGSVLGRVLRRRSLPRLTLALLCALAAEMFNLLIDLYSWSQGGAHTLSAYGAWIVSGLSFDATHVVASFLFGLTFGPALLRMLVRARARIAMAPRCRGFPRRRSISRSSCPMWIRRQPSRPRWSRPRASCSSTSRCSTSSARTRSGPAR